MTSRATFFTSFLLVVLFSRPASAHLTCNWIGTGPDFNWTNSANWQNSLVADTSQEQARFGASTKTAISISQPLSIGRIVFLANSPAYTFSKSGGYSSSEPPLTLDVTETPDLLVTSSQSGPVTFNSATRFLTTRPGFTEADFVLDENTVVTFNAPVTTAALNVAMTFAGTAYFNGAAASSIDGELSVAAGATLGGNGAITSEGVTMFGTVKPGAAGADSTSSLTLSGPLSLDLGSNVEFGIGGTAPGTFDQINGVTNIGLAGTFHIQAADGFNTTSLSNGASFQLFAWSGTASDDGYSFDFSAAPLASGLSWDDSQFASTGTLTVVPEPSVGMLLLLMGTAGLIRRRTSR